jgi:ribosomal protein S18 acetylase RimI-like enzyme
MDDLTIRDLEVAGELDLVRLLFREYEAAVGVDLCFQGFEEEVAGLPGDYTPPGGALLLALQGETVVGCVALRPWDEAIGEMKRLYVRPAGRGAGIGRELCRALISRAREIGYRSIRLDTLATMEAARSLYRSLGFVEIEAYTHNPDPGVGFFELALAVESES